MSEKLENWLFLDFGSSGTKYLALLLGLLYGGFVPSGARPLSRQPRKGLNYPVGCGVVTIADQVWRVGEVMDFCHSAALKTDSAIAKVCGLLGSLVGDREIELNLLMKLPCHEFGKRKSFAGQLKAALNLVDENGKPLKPKVFVNGKPLRVKVQSIYFHAEGSGLMPTSVGKALCINVGHSDLTVASMQDGLLKPGQSITFGTYGVGSMAKAMGVRGSDTEVAYAIVSNKLEAIAKLNGMSMAALQKLRDEVVANYFEEVGECFKTLDWQGVNAVGLGGAPSTLFRKEMPEHLIPVSFAKLRSTKGLSLFGSKLNPAQFADIYGSAEDHIGDVIAAKQSGNRVHEVDVEVVA